MRLALLQLASMRRKDHRNLRERSKRKEERDHEDGKNVPGICGVLALLFLSGLGGCATNNPDRANLDFSPLIYTGAPTVRLAP